MDMTIRFPWPDLVFERVPKAIRVFGTQFTLYGLLIALGMFFAMFFIALEARRNHQNANHYMTAFLVCDIFGIVGARLYYVFFYWSIYSADLSRIYNFREGGLAFYGGLAGGLIGLLLVCLIFRESVGRMADTLCPALLLGQVIGRWGDFFNRSSFGQYTTWPTSMQLPLSAVHSGEVTPLIRENLVMLEDVPYIQVHPTFLYESVWCLFILILLLVRRRKTFFDGEVLLRYVAGYSFGRFFIEWLRTDQLLIPGTVWSVNLVVSAGLFVLSVLILVIRRGMAKKRISYHRQRQELKYEFEERMAAEEEKRDLRREEKAEAATEGEYAAAALPEDVRQALEDLEEETRRMKEASARMEAAQDEPEAASEPEPEAPEASADETLEPEPGAPEASADETLEPEPEAPEASADEPSKPESETPETPADETSELEPEVPGTPDDETSEPESEVPEPPTEADSETETEPESIYQVPEDFSIADLLTGHPSAPVSQEDK